MRARGGGAAAGLAVLALAGLIACGEGDAEGTAGERRATARAPAATNRPLFGSDAIRLVERFRLSREASKAGLLVDPLDLALGDGGALYVLDAAEPQGIVKFDSAGRFVERFAERDERTGAPRIVFAQAFVLAPWNVVLLVDRGRNVLSSYLPIGTFASSVQLQGVGIAVLPLPEFGHFYLHKWDPQRRSSYVVHMQSPLDSLGVVYGVGISLGQPLHEEMRDIFFRTAVDRRGRLYIAFEDGYPIRVLTSDGRTIQTIHLARRAVPKPDDRIEAERGEALARLRAQAPDLPEDLLHEAAEPDSLLPVIEEIVVDPRERVWVRTHEAPEEEATTYDLFNEEGGYLAEIQVPGRVRRTAFGPDGRLFVIEEGARSAAIVGYDIRVGSESSMTEAGASRR